MAAAGALITAKYDPISPRGPAMSACSELSSYLAYCRIQPFDRFSFLLDAFIPIIPISGELESTSIHERMAITFRNIISKGL